MPKQAGNVSSWPVGWEDFSANFFEVIQFVLRPASQPSEVGRFFPGGIDGNQPGVGGPGLSSLVLLCGTDTQACNEIIHHVASDFLGPMELSRRLGWFAE